MDERPEDRLAKEIGQVLAGLAQPGPLALDLADTEPPSDELVEADPARRHVAAALAGGEDDAIGRREVLEDLGLDEGDVAVGRRIRRPSAGSDSVSVAFEPDPGIGLDALQARHRRLGCSRDVDGFDRAAVRHRSNVAAPAGAHTVRRADPRHQRNIPKPLQTTPDPIPRDYASGRMPRNSCAQRAPPRVRGEIMVLAK